MFLLRRRNLTDITYQLRALKDATYYQGNQGEVKIVQGDGNAERLEGEVNFLSHYARQLGGFIREEEVVLIGVDEGVQVNAFGFPGGSDSAGQKVCGVVFDSPHVELDEALKELNWKGLLKD